MCRGGAPRDSATLICRDTDVSRGCAPVHPRDIDMLAGAHRAPREASSRARLRPHAFGSTPFGSTPFASTPFGSTPFASTPFGSTPFASTRYLGQTPKGVLPKGVLKYGGSRRPYLIVPINKAQLAETTRKEACGCM